MKDDRRLLALAVAFATTTITPGTATAQPDAATGPARVHTAMSFSDYLARVGRANLELAAQRTNVTIAEAQIALARVFPDPQLTAGLASIDVSGQHSPTLTVLGLSQVVEIGGKRGARIRAAEAARTVTQAEVEDFLRLLRANAAGAFIDALAARLELEQKRRSLASLERLVKVNEQRVRAGDIGEIALAKARVEAQRFKGDVLLAEGDLAAANLALALHIGGPEASGTTPDPQGKLELARRDFSDDKLLAAAREHRPDLIAQRLSIKAGAARVDLARANRIIDLGLGLGWQHSAAAGGRFDQPRYEALAATLTLPLPFSRLYRGELQGALAGEAQAKLLVGSIELRIEIEVLQALARYRAAAERVQLYSHDTVADAERVSEASLYNYQRGGATLLEVLDAQRTLNEVYLSYYDALRSQARALVEVETAAGLWEIGL